MMKGNADMDIGAEIIFIIIVFLFIMGSMFGWVLELFFRRFISTSNPERRWINPGFLVGPWLPIYGFGLVLLFFLSLIPYLSIDLKFNKVLLMILIMGLSMTLIEYIAGRIFINGMHIKLWDYSDIPFNFQGIICLRFSIIWTLLGALYYYFINPHVVRMVTWLNENIAFSFVVGFVYGMITIDVCYSLGIVSKVRNFAVNNNIIVYYEELRLQVHLLELEAKSRQNFLFSLKSNLPLKNVLERYLERYRERIRKITDIRDQK